MEITFTRTGTGDYTTVVKRDDGVTFSVPSFDRTHALPHDLAHFVVESVLGLDRGFWGSIAAGAVFAGMTRISGRLPPHSAERAAGILREAGQKGTEAEVFVSAFLDVVRRNLDRELPAALARIAAEWSPAKGARTPPTPEELRRVCAGLRDAEARWQALAVGETLRVTWPASRRRRASARSGR
jgi:hypothetical protein